MTALTQALPTAAGAAADLARMIARLLGPAYQAPDASQNADAFLALGSALATSRGVTITSLSQAFPDAATNLLDEWEVMLALSPGAGLYTTAQRQTRLLARWRTRFAGTPNAIIAALTPLNGVAPVIRETLASESHANPRRVFAFTFKVNVDPNDAAAIAPFDATVAVMKPAITRVQFTNTQMSGFFCNSAASLTNNTVL